MNNCPKCNAPVAAGAAEGLCSACLLRGALNPHHSNPPESDEAALEDDPLPPPGGTLRFGDYELVEPIARGGMGVVWRARQPRLHRVVALKLIRAGRFAGPDDVRRFLLEAEAAARLDHPNIVPIYEFGDHDGRHFFTMKLIEGGSLAEALKRSTVEAEARSALQPSNASTARLLSKVARAVHYAHARGVLHRDLKPANILLDAQGEPYVTDFGLAKFVVPLSGSSGAPEPAKAGTPSPLTLTGQTLGTPAYMAPEQAAGPARDLTIAADVYSLGAIFFHLLTGRPPFDADTPLATLRQVVEQEPPRPSALHSLVDRDLETICLKCLEKDPQRRYSTALALAEELERWLAGESILARPSSVWRQGIKWAKRRPARAGLLALALVGPAIIIALLLVDEARLRRERRHTDEQRNNALQQEQKATAAATRAEAGELAARERAYAADIYAAFQALGVDDLALARRLLNEHRPAIVVPALAGSETNSILTRTPAEAGTTNMAQRSTPNAQPSTDLRGFEWRVLWERTCGHEAFAFTNLARPAKCLVFAPDGRTLVSGGDDGIHLWDIVERRPLGLFPGPDPGPPNGDLAPTVEDVRPMLDASPAVVEHLRAQPEILDYLDALGHTNRTRDVTSLAFTPDGTHLLVGSADFVRSWNFVTRAFEFAVSERSATVAVPATGDHFFVGSHERLASSDDRRSAHPRSATVYSFSNRRLLAELPGYGDRGAISPDGQSVVAVSRTNGAVLWRPATGETIRLSHDPRFAGTPAFSPDGRLLILGSDTGRPTMLWHLASKRVIAYLNQSFHGGPVAWSPDGRTVAGRGNQHISLWTVPPVGTEAGLAAGTPLLSPKIVLHGHEAAVTALAFSHDGRWLVSAASDHSIRFWAIADALAAVAPATSGPDRPMHEFAMDPATGCLIGRAGRELAVWDPQRAYSLSALPGTEEQFHAGFLARGAGFITVKMTTNDTPTHLEIRRLPDGAVQSRRAVFSVPKELEPDGSGTTPRLAASSDGQWLVVCRSFGRKVYAYVYSVATGHFVTRLRTPQRWSFRSLHFSPDSRLLIVTERESGQNSIAIFDTSAWRLAREICFGSAGDDVNLAAVDPTSRFLATGGPAENSLRIWELQTGRLVGQCSGSGSGIDLVWSRDGRTLVTETRLWSAIVFRELAALPSGLHFPLGFTADGRALVTIDVDGHVKTCSPPTLSEIDRPAAR